MSPRVIQGSLIINDEGIVIASCGATYSMMLPSLLYDSVYSMHHPWSYCSDNSSFVWYYLCCMATSVIYRLCIINGVFLESLLVLPVQTIMGR